MQYSYILALLFVAEIAAQPYCLLTAVNKFEHPADQKTLCCQDASKVKDYLKQLCPSGDESSAVDSFNTACKDAGYGTCSSSSSRVSSASETGSASGSGKALATSAPYPVTKTSTYYDTECSCTKTKVHTSSGVAGSTGFATGTAPVATGTTPVGPAAGASGASGAGATGSPIVPTASVTGSSTSPSSTAKSFTGAANKNVGSVVAGLLAVAAIAMAL